MPLIRLAPRFRKADRLLSEFAAREGWSRAAIEAYQLSAINSLWQHAIVHVPYYTTLRKTKNLPDAFATLEEFRDRVPILKKELVRRDPQPFRSVADERGFWCRTGGSTGAPMNAFWGKEAMLEVLRSKYRAFQMWDIDYLDRIAFLWGHSNFFQPGIKGMLARLRQPIEDYFRNRLRLSAYQIEPAQLSRYLRRLQQFRPRAIYGYPTALSLLAKQAVEEGVTLDSLRLIVATGEPVLKPTVREIEGAFGVPTVTEYGSVECGHIAHEWPDRTLRVREDVTFVETIEQETSHAIVVTPLFNRAFPLLRYEIEDNTSQPVEYPTQGFAILADVIGRSNDFLVARDGQILHSARLDALFKYECKGIRRFRVYQHENGVIEVQIELVQQIDGVDERVKELLTQVTQFPVSVFVIDEFDLSAAGKHRVLVSELAQKTFPSP